MLKLPRITLGIVLLLIMLFLYSQAEFVYGPYSGIVKNVLTVYFFLLVMVLAATRSKMPMMEARISTITGFAIGYIITAVVMFAVLSIPGSPAFLAETTVERIKIALGFGLLHGFVKAYIEEAIFRGILPQFLGKGNIGDGLSSVMFGFFHAGVSGASFMAMGFLMVLGFIWAKMRDRFGLMASVGSHTCYNHGVMGILPAIFGVGVV